MKRKTPEQPQPTDSVEEVRFQAAGIAFHIEGDPSLCGVLRVMYGRFPLPMQPLHTVHLHWQALQCIWRVDHRPARFLRVTQFDFRPAATTILLSQILDELRPDLLNLHGNALVDNASKTVLLLGDSGAGKTTLTQELCNQSDGSRLLAEDVILIDPNAGTLLPFPRASARRVTVAGIEAIAWQGFGHGSPKELHHTEKTCLDPVAFGSSAIVILRRASVTDADPMESNHPERIWTSCLDQDVVTKLTDALLPVAHWNATSDMGHLKYARPLDPEQRQVQAQIFEDSGVLLLHTESTEENDLPLAPRPSAPTWKDLSPAEGVRATLGFLRRSPRRATDEPAGMAFMRLARALGRCRFSEVIPGGTPQQTAQLIEARLA